jgi:hypothetical protein
MYLTDQYISSNRSWLVEDVPKRFTLQRGGQWISELADVTAVGCGYEKAHPGGSFEMS